MRSLVRRRMLLKMLLILEFIVDANIIEML